MCTDTAQNSNMCLIKNGVDMPDEQPIAHPNAGVPMQVQPPHQAPPEAATNPDAMMRYVQGVRMNIAQNLINGGALSGTTESTEVLLDVLKDMGSQAVQQKRIEVDSNTASALGDASAIVNRVLDMIDSNTGVYKGPPIDVPARVLSENTEGFSAVPGEMDTAPPQGSYQEFVGRMRGEQEPTSQTPKG